MESTQLFLYGDALNFESLDRDVVKKIIVQGNTLLKITERELFDSELRSFEHNKFLTFAL